jgi:hypothetical protein
MRRKEERAWERAAWMTHYIMGAWMGEDAPPIERLLRTPRR